jgi:hypothetical protein
VMLTELHTLIKHLELAKLSVRLSPEQWPRCGGKPK